MRPASAPLRVVVAAWLLPAYAVLSLARIAIYGSGLPTSAAGIALWAVVLAMFACLARGLYRGRNWMRRLLLVSVLAALVLLPIYKPGLPTGPQLGLYLLQFLLPVAATALLFTRRANAWFAR